MGNKFTIIIIALGVAWFSGWLFANEVAPPRYDDLSFAVSFVLGGVALVGALGVAVAR
jgi:hypothetical protein